MKCIRKIDVIKIEGFTLPEMMVSLVLLSILVGLLFSLSNTFNRVNYRQILMSDLKTQTQRAVRTIDRNLIRSKRFFERDSEYQDLIPWSEIPEPVSWSRDPVVAPVGVFNTESPDYDADIFGNKLFFAKVENSAAFDAGGKSYDINLYRFQLYYLTEDTLHPSRPYDYSLCLLKWESNLFANYWDLEHLWNDTVSHSLGLIKSKLSNDFGVNHCWEVAEPNPDQAFYRIGNFDSPVSIVFQTASMSYLVRPIAQTIGISFNNSDVYPVSLQVPAFALSDGDFPGGFEVGVIGSSSSRKVLLRIVSSGRTRKRVISYESMTVVSSPEY